MLSIWNHFFMDFWIGYDCFLCSVTRLLVSFCSSLCEFIGNWESVIWLLIVTVRYEVFLLNWNQVVIDSYSSFCKKLLTKNCGSLSGQHTSLFKKATNQVTSLKLKNRYMPRKYQIITERNRRKDKKKTFLAFASII